jgi:hypothetical protein
METMNESMKMGNNFATLCVVGNPLWILFGKRGSLSAKKCN